MLTLKELREKHKAKLAEARAAIANGATAEARTRYDALMLELSDIAGDITRLSNLENAEAEERSRIEAEERAIRAGRPQLPQPGTVENGTGTEQEQRNAQYRSAFTHYVQTGDLTQLRAMGTTTGASGGYLIPRDMADIIEQAILTFGGVASHLGQFGTDTGEQIDYPLSNDTANAAVVIGENSVDAPNQDLTVGTVPSTVATLTTKYVLVSNQVLQDSKFNLQEFITNNLIERANRGLSNLLINAGDSNFDALKSVPVGTTTAAGAVSTIGLTDITGLFGAVDPAYANKGKFVMNRDTQLYLSQQRTANGVPVFPLDSTGLLSNLYGRPVVIDTYMPLRAAGNVTVVFGDLTKYLFRRVSGFAIRRLDERFALSNQTAFVGFFRAGGRLLDAGTHPIQSLKQAAA